MPKGIYQHKPLSEDHKKKIGLKSIGRKTTLGKHWKLTEERKKEIGKAHKGKKLSEEHKRKISKANKGKLAWNKGLPMWWNPGGRFKKGYKPSEETKRKMSELMKRNTNGFKKGQSPWNKNKKCFQLSGKNNWNWKNGITSENRRIKNSIEYRLWREAVFARDNWTCQVCGVQGIYLHPHHIQNFAKFLELRFAINNGITFCRNCHIEFHNKYGRKNNTKEQLEELLEKVAESLK